MCYLIRSDYSRVLSLQMTLDTRAQVSGKMNEGMCMPYKKVLDRVKKGK